MSTSTSTTSSNLSNESNKINQIKLCLISQESEKLNIPNLFKDFFEFINPKTYNIKSEHKFEFIPNLRKNFNVIIRHLININKLKVEGKLYDNIIIFLDINKKECFEKLNSILSSIISTCYDESKKYFIIGFYNEKEEKFIKDIQINNLLETNLFKQFEYFEIELSNYEELDTIFKLITKETYQILKEKKKGDNRSHIQMDKSTCNIF